MVRQLLKYCVIPAGGQGSRWTPVTNYIPKIMIPLFDRPTIDWVLKEAIDSGCSEIILVYDKGKDLVRKHVARNKKFKRNARIHFLYQEKIRGIAEVMHLSKRIVGNNHYSMIISDHPCFYHRSPPLVQMERKFIQLPDMACLMAFAEYPKYNNLPYGECLLQKIGGLYQIHHLCPRPKNPNIDHHPRNKLRMTGRYIINPLLNPVVEECLKKHKIGDLSDWDVFEIAKNKSIKYWGTEIKSHFLDVGNLESYGIASKFLYERK